MGPTEWPCVPYSTSINFYIFGSKFTLIFKYVWFVVSNRIKNCAQNCQVSPIVKMKNFIYDFDVTSATY